MKLRSNDQSQRQPCCAVPIGARPRVLSLTARGEEEKKREK